MPDVSAALDWGPGMIEDEQHVWRRIGAIRLLSACFPSGPEGTKGPGVGCLRCLLKLPCFYAHRLWIISGNNKIITAAVSSEFVRIVCWSLESPSVVLNLFHAGSPGSHADQYPRKLSHFRKHVVGSVSQPLLRYRTTEQAASLSLGYRWFSSWAERGSIFFYLQPQRSGIKRMATTIQELINVFVNMGFFTCLVSLVLFIFNWTQNGQYWIGAPAPIICKYQLVTPSVCQLNAGGIEREEDYTRTCYEDYRTADDTGNQSTGIND
ncbi:hypothetical protein BV22DRAFT_1048607 [Leucogyrophana mollusca]|uniref:Uncharacterized protein n=1 Tax=Leucogyrophana mollusca TaxID=85980 RepID=A0ACB8BDA4_9AGAM|nr:hypothetical protein BV22DRAFT_1048607 [Leucogyrophana mollusca]